MEKPTIEEAAARYGSADHGKAYPGPCEMHEQPLLRSLDAAVLASEYLRVRAAKLAADREAWVTTFKAGEWACTNCGAVLPELPGPEWRFGDVPQHKCPGLIPQAGHFDAAPVGGAMRPGTETQAAEAAAFDGATGAVPRHVYADGKVVVERPEPHSYTGKLGPNNPCETCGLPMRNAAHLGLPMHIVWEAGDGK